MAGRIRRRRRSSAGVALLMVISAITILALVLLEFSGSTRTHLSAGTNIRDDVRAQTLAHTGLALTRACLDPKAWGPLGAMQDRLDLQQLCSMMLGIFAEKRLDLPIGGLSMELPEGVEGVGLIKGQLEISELVPESAFIGLNGLWSQRPGGAMQQNTVRLLRSVLCDPSIAHIFETEQADGKEYTRADIVGNIIDWIDPDDSRVQVDLTLGTVAQDLGEGEDSYYRDLGGDDRYRVKDGPLDSIQELRLIRGINDELYDFLKDKVSVYSTGKIDANKVPVGVLAAMLKAASGLMAVQESDAVCGQQSDTRDVFEEYIESYAQMIVEARQAKSLMAGLANPFKGPNGVKAFVQLVGDPVAALVQARMTLFGGLGQAVDPDVAKLEYLISKGWTITAYQTIQAQFANSQFDALVSTESSVYRVRTRGKVGNITRTVFAVVKRDGPTVRTLYYREE